MTTQRTTMRRDRQTAERLALVLEDESGSDEAKVAVTNHIIALSNQTRIDVADARLVRFAYPVIAQVARAQGLIVAEGVPLIAEAE
jgi:hypothetical protein